MQDEKGKPWFVGKDVARMLGYSNTRDSLRKHVDVEDKTTVAICDTGSNYKSKASLRANCKFARTKDCKSSQTKDGVTICDSINRTTTLIQGIGINYKSRDIRMIQDEKGELWFVGSDIARELSYFDLRKIGWFRVSIDFSFI